MGEDSYPNNSYKDNLDLGMKFKEISKNNSYKLADDKENYFITVAERDKYMFLETLISTKQKLILTYVYKDDKTDSELNPSSIINTLIEELNDKYLKENFKITYTPLNKYSNNSFKELINYMDKKKRGKGEIVFKNWDQKSYYQSLAVAYRNKNYLNYSDNEKVFF